MALVPVEPFAQEFSQAPSRLPAVEVTAEPVAPEEERLEETIPTTAVKREQFQDQPNGMRVNDIAKRLPGFYTGGAPGEDKDARLRGLDKEFTRTTVDGIPIPDGGEKRELNLDRIPASMVEQVRIIRLPSAEYEADGIAGRVDIVSRPIPRERIIEGSFAVGDQGRITDQHSLFNLTYGERFNERFGVLASLSRNDIPSIKTRTKQIASGVTTERENDEKPTTYTDLRADLGYFYNSGELHLRPIMLESTEDHDKTKLKYNNAGVFTGSEIETEAPRRKTVGTTLGIKHNFTDGVVWDADTGIFVSEEDKEKTKRVLNAAGVENLANREVETEDKPQQIWLVRSNVAVPFATDTLQHTAKTGVSFRQRDREKNKSRTRGGVSQTLNAKDTYTLDETYLATYVQDEMRPVDTVSITPGVRLETVFQDSASSDGTERQSTFVDALPSLPVAWRVRPDVILKAGVARLVNRPQFDQLAPFADDSTAGKLIIGNPDLQPARAWAYEAGVEYVTAPIFLAANLFYRDIKGVIESRPTGEVVNGRTVEQVQNVGDGWVRGIELEQRIDLSYFTDLPVFRGFRLTFNQTFLDSELTPSSGVKQPFKDQPPYLLNFILDWRDRAWGTSASIALRRAGGIDQAIYGHENRPAETFVDMRVAQRIFEGVELFFLAYNITDQGRTKYKSDGSVERELTGPAYFLGTSFRF